MILRHHFLACLLEPCCLESCGFVIIYYALCQVRDFSLWSLPFTHPRAISPSMKATSKAERPFNVANVPVPVPKDIA